MIKQEVTFSCVAAHENQLPKKTYEVSKMTKNNENILKIDEVLDELYYLREENEKLKANNKIMADELTYFKEHCADLENQVAALKKQYDDCSFGYKPEFLISRECENIGGK